MKKGMRAITKKFFYLIAFLLMSIGLIGCGETSKDHSSSLKISFEAVVIENGENLVVAPDKSSNEAKSSDKIVVRANNASIMNVNGQEIQVEDIPTGYIVEITYNGEIMESYPAQIFAEKIQLCEINREVEAYLKIIDDIYQEDSGLNEDISIIAIDTTDLKNLSDWEKQILLIQIEKKYGKEVVEGTYDELVEKGFIDQKKNRYFPEGILISITNPSFSENKEELTYEIMKWRSGTGAIGYTGTAHYDSGKWMIEKENMWMS